MRITKYNLEVPNVLVKEKSFNYETSALRNSLTVADFLKGAFRLDRQAEECLYMIAVDTRFKPIGVFEVSRGTVNQSFVSPREIFIRALLVGAVGIFVAHNHPSGDVTPSGHDTEATRAIAEAGKLLKVELLDHIIVGGDCYYSFRDEGKL